MTRVSVIIPVYNIERHLRQCLDSVAGQTLSELQIICGDDGSSDASAGILAEYAARDSRFQIITQANAGPGAARNAGMERAQGDFLIFLDSDDWFESDLLEEMTARALETGADVTVCRSVEFDSATGRERLSEWMLKTCFLPASAFTAQEIAPHLFQFTYGWPWDKLYRMDYLKREGFRYPPLPNSEDLVYVFPSLAAARRIAVTERTLVHHRVNRSASVSNSRHLDPGVPYQAVRLLEAELRSRDLYCLYERSFLNWAMEFLVWNASNMGDAAAGRQFFHALREEWMPALDFRSHAPAYYEDKTIYCKYLLARYLPWPVFSAIVRGYHALKSRRGAWR